MTTTLIESVIDMVTEGYPHTSYISNDEEIQELINETWRTMDRLFTEALYKGTNMAYSTEEGIRDGDKDDLE